MPQKSIPIGLSRYLQVAVVCIALWPAMSLANPKSDASAVDQTDGELREIACASKSFRNICKPCESDVSQVQPVRQVRGNIHNPARLARLQDDGFVNALTGEPLGPGDDKPDEDPDDRLVEFEGCGSSPVSALMVPDDDDPWKVVDASKGLSLAMCRKLPLSHGLELEWRDVDNNPREFLLCEQPTGEPGGRRIMAYVFRDGHILSVELYTYQSEPSSCQTSTYELTRLVEWRLFDGRLIAHFEETSGQVPDRFAHLCEARQDGFSVWDSAQNRVTVFRFASQLHMHARMEILGGYKVFVLPVRGGHPSLPGGRH